MHFGLALPRQQVGCVGRKHVTNLGPIAMPISKIEYDFQNISDQLKSVPASFFWDYCKWNQSKFRDAKKCNIGRCNSTKHLGKAKNWWLKQWAHHISSISVTFWNGEPLLNHQSVALDHLPPTQKWKSRAPGRGISATKGCTHNSWQVK